MRRRLEGVAFLQNSQLVMISRTRASVRLTYFGNPEQLQTALAQRDIVLERGAVNWVLRDAREPATPAWPGSESAAPVLSAPPKLTDLGPPSEGATGESAKPDYLWPPLSVPVAVYMIMQSAHLAAFILFVLAGISDALDVPRQANDQTAFLGAILDPLADKTLLVGVPQHWDCKDICQAGWCAGGVSRPAYRRRCHHPVSGAARSEDAALITQGAGAAQLALAAIVLAKLGFPFDMDGLVHAAIYIVGDNRYFRCQPGVMDPSDGRSRRKRPSGRESERAEQLALDLNTRRDGAGNFLISSNVDVSLGGQMARLAGPGTSARRACWMR